MESHPRKTRASKLAESWAIIERMGRDCPLPVSASAVQTRVAKNLGDFGYGFVSPREVERGKLRIATQDRIALRSVFLGELAILEQRTANVLAQYL